MNSLLAIFFLFIALTSCKESLTPDYFDKICDPNSKFSVDSSETNYVTESTYNYLNMKTITTPSDTFFMRAEYFADSIMRIFEYSFYKLEASYKIYTFPVDHDFGLILFDKNKDTLEKFIKIVKPQNGDRAFIDALEKFEVFDLTASNKIANYPKDWDEIYTIQYSNKCRYNVFSFKDPYKNKEKFKEANNLVKFLEYLKKEFEF